MTRITELGEAEIEPDKELSDAELLTQSRGGDMTALGTLWRRHLPMISRLARHLTGDHAAADDLTQEVGLRFVATVLGGGGPDRACKSYLQRMLKNSFIDTYRRTRNEVASDLPGQEFAEDESAAADVESVVERDLLHNALSALTPRDQSVLILLEVEDAPRDRAAAILGLTSDAVSVLRARARGRLRTSYLQQFVPPTTEVECAEFTPDFSRYVRGQLGRTRSQRIERHSRGCVECTAAITKLRQLNSQLPAILMPAAIGSLELARELVDSTGISGTSRLAPMKWYLALWRGRALTVILPGLVILAIAAIVLVNVAHKPEADAGAEASPAAVASVADRPGAREAVNGAAQTPTEESPAADVAPSPSAPQASPTPDPAAPVTDESPTSDDVPAPGPAAPTDDADTDQTSPARSLRTTLATPLDRQGLPTLSFSVVNGLGSRSSAVSVEITVSGGTTIDPSGSPRCGAVSSTVVRCSLDTLAIDGRWGVSLPLTTTGTGGTITAVATTADGHTSSSEARL